MPEEKVNCMDCSWSGLAKNLDTTVRTGPCGKLHNLDTCPECKSMFIYPPSPADLED